VIHAATRPADDTIESPGMSINIAPNRREPSPRAERRVRRIELPDCPSCHTPLHVDVRSEHTLYVRCQWCGHRRMVAKPPAASGQQRR
jgi:DNA-directed RNA polymerase subunit RPC12/RpoP